MTLEQEQELSTWLQDNLQVDVDVDYDDVDGHVTRVKVYLNIYDPTSKQFRCVLN